MPTKARVERGGDASRLDQLDGITALKPDIVALLKAPKGEWNIDAMCAEFVATAHVVDRQALHLEGRALAVAALNAAHKTARLAYLPKVFLETVDARLGHAQSALAALVAIADAEMANARWHEQSGDLDEKASHQTFLGDMLDKIVALLPLLGRYQEFWETAPNVELEPVKDFVFQDAFVKAIFNGWPAFAKVERHGTIDRALKFAAASWRDLSLPGFLDGDLEARLRRSYYEKVRSASSE